MSVTIDEETVIKTLWSPADGKSGAFRAQPSVLSNGQLLRLVVQQSVGGKITDFCFHPLDEARAAFGTNTGLLYGISLRENKTFLLADAAGCGIRGISFCGGRSDASCYVVVAAEGNSLWVIQWSSGRVVQRLPCGPHSRPITALLPVVTTSQAQYTLCVSADSLSLWSLYQISANPGGISGNHLGGSAMELPAFNCVGFAHPSQSMLTNQSLSRNGLIPAGFPNADTPKTCVSPQSSSDHDRNGTARGPFFFLAAATLFLDGCLCLLALETNGVLSKWILAEGEDSHRLREKSSDHGVCRAFELERCVETLPFLPGCIAACSRFVVLGNRESATIALVEMSTLSSLGALDLQTGATPVSASHSDAVLQVAIVSETLVLCTLINRKVIGVSISASKGDSYHQLFTIAPPQPLERHSSGIAAWRLAMPSFGLSIGVFFCEAELLYLHLPTTLEHARRRERLYGEPGAPVKGLTNLETAPLEGFKVLPFLKDSQEDGAPGKAGDLGLRNRKGTQLGSGDSTLTVCKPKGYSIDAFRFPRRPLVFDAAHSRAKWIDVNAVEGRGEGGGARPGICDTPTQAVTRDGQRAMELLSRTLHSDSMDDETCRYNMDKLHTYLNKYGVFPSKYHAVIWRFILGLPNKRVTAPQFASLARRPPHECVAVFMKPFGLPPGRIRSTIESVISVLAHHARVFAIASFLPSMTYPLCRVYEDDAQSIVEVLLTFFSNWGREFFVCYPQPPSMLGAFLTRCLEKQDAELAKHFDHIGAGFEVWGWDAMQSFFTDMLSGAEWLQVMDHAFMMNPMWLFMFLLSYLVHLREVLLPLRAACEVLEELRRPHSSAFPVSGVIEQAYGMLQTCPRNASFMEPYFALLGWGPSYAYPKEFLCDAEVLEAKSDEICLLRRQEEEKAATRARLRELREEAEAAALREEMLLQREHAVITAKYDSSADLWRSRVELERAQQERLKKERELRLFIVDSKLASAEQIEHLEGKKQQAERQLRDRFVDGLMAEQAWELGKLLTDDELARLEKTAEERMNSALQKLVSPDYSDLPSSVIRTATTGVDESGKMPVGVFRPPLSASFSFPGEVNAVARRIPEVRPSEEDKLPPETGGLQQQPFAPRQVGSLSTKEQHRSMTVDSNVNKKIPAVESSLSPSGGASKSLGLSLSTREIAEKALRGTQPDADPNSEEISSTREESAKSTAASSTKISQFSPPPPLNSRAINMAVHQQKAPYKPPVKENVQSQVNQKVSTPVASSSFCSKQRHLEPFEPFSAWCEDRANHEIRNSTHDMSTSLYNPTQQRYLAMQRRALEAGKRAAFAGGRGAEDSLGNRHSSPFHSHHSKQSKRDTEDKFLSSLPERASRPKLYDNMPRSSSLQDHSSHPHHPHLISPAAERMRAFYASHPINPSEFTTPLSSIPTSSTSTMLPTHTTTTTGSSLATRTISASSKSITAGSYLSNSTGKVKTIVDPSDEKEEIRQKASDSTTCTTLNFSSNLDMTSAGSVIERPHRDNYYSLPPQLNVGSQKKC